MEVHYCKECRLFNKKDQQCEVIVYTPDGQKLQIGTEAKDECHWERVEREINEQLGNAIAHEPSVYFRSKLIDEYTKPIEVKQLRMWSNGKDGFIESSSD